jgi:hypothetical protein
VLPNREPVKRGQAVVDADRRSRATEAALRVPAAARSDMRLLLPPPLGRVCAGASRWTAHSRSQLPPRPRGSRGHATRTMHASKEGGSSRRWIWL